MPRSNFLGEAQRRIAMLTEAFANLSRRDVTQFSALQEEYIKAVDSRDMDKVTASVNNILAELGADKDSIYGLLPQNKDFEATLRLMHKLLADSDEESKAALEKKGLSDFETIKSDSIKKRQLTSLFFARLQDAEIRKSLAEAISKKIMAEPTSAEEQNRAYNNVFNRMHADVKQAISTQKMHAYYDPHSSLGVFLFDFMHLAVVCGVASAVPSLAPGIASTFEGIVPGGPAADSATGTSDIVMGPDGRPMPGPLAQQRIREELGSGTSLPRMVPVRG